MRTVENLTLDEAIYIARFGRDHKDFYFLGIYPMGYLGTESANDMRYSVTFHDKAEADRRKKAEAKPQEADSLPAFEIMRNYIDPQGNSCGWAVYSAETLEELLKFDPTSFVDEEPGLGEDFE